mmetsp:Transcript_29346/g.91213  ORF Transcript_29346/g.91213 Transcript_29346/m.91213 type:complete len:361 (+) Transcript_29346:47-1129(+)
MRGAAPHGEACNPEARGEILVHHLLQEDLREAQVVAGRAVELDLSCLVQGLQPEPVLDVPRRVLHGDQLTVGAVLEEAKVLTLLGLHHGVVLGHDEHQPLEGLEVVSVCGVHLVVHLVVDERQEVPVLAVHVQAIGVPVVVCLGEAVLHEGGVEPEVADEPVDGLADRADARHVHGALGEPGDAHHRAVHGEERLDWGAVVAVDVAADERVALREADGVEPPGELRVGADDAGKLVHLVVHRHEEAVALVLRVTARELPGLGAELHAGHVGAGLLRDELSQRDHAHGVVCKVPHAVHHHHRGARSLGRRSLNSPRSVGAHPDNLAEALLGQRSGGLLGRASRSERRQRREGAAESGHGLR